MKTNLIFTSIVLLVLSLKSQSQSLEEIFSNPNVTIGIEIGNDYGEPDLEQIQFLTKDTMCGGSLVYQGLSTWVLKFEGEKMYSTYNYDNCKALKEVFDFGLQVGDSYTINYQEYQVKKIIDSLFLDGVNRRIFYLENENNRKIEAIEGIGLSSTAFNVFTSHPFLGEKFICLVEDSTILYLGEDVTKERCEKTICPEFCPNQILTVNGLSLDINDRSRFIDSIAIVIDTMLATKEKKVNIDLDAPDCLKIETTYQPICDAPEQSFSRIADISFNNDCFENIEKNNSVSSFNLHEENKYVIFNDYYLGSTQDDKIIKYNYAHTPDIVPHIVYSDNPNEVVGLFKSTIDGYLTHYIQIKDNEPSKLPDSIHFGYFNDNTLIALGNNRLFYKTYDELNWIQNTYASNIMLNTYISNGSLRILSATKNNDTYLYFLNQNYEISDSISIDLNKVTSMKFLESTLLSITDDASFIFLETQTGQINKTEILDNVDLINITIVNDSTLMAHGNDKAHYYSNDGGQHWKMFFCSGVSDLYISDEGHPILSSGKGIQTYKYDFNEPCLLSSVSNSNINSNVIFYPNPANNTIQCNQDLETLQIYDTNGSLFRTYDNVKAYAQLNLGFLKSGTYIAKAVHNKTSTNHKLIVMR